MTDTCRSGARMYCCISDCVLSKGCWNFWLMLFAITSLRDVNKCCVGGSAKTEGGRSNGFWQEGLREDAWYFGVIGDIGVTGKAGDGLLSSGGGKVGIFSITDGGESVRSGSLSGSDSC